MSDQPKITLYYFATCPFCVRVMMFLKQHRIDIPWRNIHKDPGAAQELMAVGGKTQVPCLVIEGKALYESADIIAWLKRHYLNQ